ncbi:uncharacterized protein H6S33_003952 [Morchella sextelata]|uniref:uncharacterized protein n=1 Tax=Morchella sextelata TaxID=1174677 RepID=UPI001D04AB20|nr:uncharacterized protein H6S33_003952 [Morchella sextelata]KAH0606291.1 hypothetical protein H6S33_003952 [Morchella sextelata]
MFSNTTFRAASRLSSRQVSPLLKSTSVRATSSSFSAQTRSAGTTSENVTQDQAYSILVAQRKLRPVSPHLTIYQPQLTWYLSALNRITGVALSGGIYVFALAYLAAPTFGLHLESATIAAAFGSLPVAAKVGIKAAVALPFTFHSWNGIRHLLWDTGKALDIKGVYRTGYVVLGLTTLSTVYLAFM